MSLLARSGQAPEGGPEPMSGLVSASPDCARVGCAAAGLEPLTTWNLEPRTSNAAMR